MVFATDQPDVDGPAEVRVGPLGLLGGVPMLSWAVSALRAASVEQLIVVIGPASGTGVGQTLVGEAPLAEVRRALDRSLPGHGAVVLAGARGQHWSLHRALSVVDSRIDTVLLHDAVWPLAPAELVSRVLDAVRRGAAAAVPAVDVTETVKELDPAGRVTSTVPRESLRRLQMPRAVRRSLLDAAHAGCRRADPDTASTDGTGPDDTLLLVPPDTPLVTVAGDHDAFPVVRPADLALAEAVRAGH